MIIEENGNKKISNDNHEDPYLNLPQINEKYNFFRLHYFKNINENKSKLISLYLSCENKASISKSYLARN